MKDRKKPAYRYDFFELYDFQKQLSLFNFFSLLNGEDKLALKTTSQTVRKFLQDNQQLPYTTQVDFVIGLSAHFYEKNHFLKAWEIYKNVTTSNSLHPAVLYKLTDWKNLALSGSITTFLANEHAAKTGRIYSPDNLHNWTTNQSWLLANINIGRDFMIYSELTPHYIKRRFNPTQYSALAKEVAVLIKAGYTATVEITGRVKLSANQNVSTPLRMHDINVTDTEIQQAVDMVNSIKEKAIKRMAINKAAKVAANHCHDALKELQTLNVSELKDARKSFAKIILAIITPIFQNDDQRELALNCFVKAFNNSPSNVTSLTLATDDSLPLKERIRELAQDIIAAVKEQIDAFITASKRLNAKS